MNISHWQQPSAETLAVLVKMVFICPYWSTPYSLAPCSIDRNNVALFKCMCVIDIFSQYCLYIET